MIPARLVAEGSSDEVLLHPLRWLLEALSPAPVDLRWVDLRGRPRRTTRDKVDSALEEGPCRLLFVHRDADAAAPEARRAEIAEACGSRVVFVPVVPVRETESWLLLDEPALRGAAGCPRGAELALPPPRQVESVADPKSLLRDLLTTASALSGRRRVRFDPVAARTRAAELVDDWGALRQLGAFRRVEADTRRALDALGQPLYPER